MQIRVWQGGLLEGPPRLQDGCPLAVFSASFCSAISCLYPRSSYDLMIFCIGRDTYGLSTSVNTCPQYTVQWIAPVWEAWRHSSSHDMVASYYCSPICVSLTQRKAVVHLAHCRAMILSIVCCCYGNPSKPIQPPHLNHKSCAMFHAVSVLSIPCNNPEVFLVLNSRAKGDTLGFMIFRYLFFSSAYL